MPRLTVTDTVSLYHLKRTGNKEEYDTAPAYTQKNACISPTGTDIQTSGEVGAFQLFELFLYDMTMVVRNADKIVTQAGIEYVVDGQSFVINNQFLKYIRCLVRQVV